jgi:hypothetical protein
MNGHVAFSVATVCGSRLPAVDAAGPDCREL